MNKEHLTTLKHKRKPVGGGSRVKQGTKDKNRNGVQGWRQVKTHLELNLERVTKAKKGSFHRNNISKRKPKENLGQNKALRNQS